MMSTTAAPLPTDPNAAQPWYRGLSKYHWFVLLVCWCGWLFDTMAQQLFTLSRTPAITSLLESGASKELIKYYGGIATMVLIFGWATGGIFFGYLGDKWGRAKTLVVSVLFYSFFTAVSSLSVSWIDFAIYRFLTGLGVGGTFAAAVSLVAETLPARSRPYALGFLQSLAACGNVAAAAASLYLKPSAMMMGWEGWRWLFLVGALPAVLVIFVMRRLKEPEAWVKAKEAERRGELKKGQKLGSMKELFGDPRWRRNVIVGFFLGLAGVVGLWSIGFWLPELVREVVPGKAEGDWYVSWAMILFNASAAIGTYLFTLLMARIGRRQSFALIFIVAIASVFCVFGFMTQPSQVWWMATILGLGTLTIFGGYSIYFPELFPARLRATGVGFCYNTARYLAATFPFVLGYLTTLYVDWHPTILSSLGSVDSPFRYAAFTVAIVFVVGLIAIPFGPETKGKPLPE
ncbi:MAG: MFS transporter [Planctomycetota bacterium]|nr:MFS transporter [Planctomycetota bacterium]